MKELRDAAKASADRKLASYKGGSSGSSFNDKGHWGNADKPVDGSSKSKDKKTDDGVEPVKLAKDGGCVGRLDKSTRKGRKAGGRVFEGSAKDVAEDAKLAKKHGMSMKDWEKSKLDEKHDEQQSMKGLRKGGRTERASGGRVGKGKTIVNVVVSPPAGQGAGAVPPPAAPVPVPVPMPPAGGPPAGGPPVLPPGGGGLPPGVMPMMRKRGGRITSTDDLTAGALSGEGRLQKVELQKAVKGRK